LQPKGRQLCSLGLQPVENGSPQTAEPSQGATERIEDDDEDDDGDERKWRAPTKDHTSLGHPSHPHASFMLDMPSHSW
jgi:hypothetical protein